MQFNLPYFDMILSRLACGDPEFEETFRRHIHFGAWEDPDSAYSDRSDSIEAMERLCQHLIGIADIRQGQDILDVGCGFGGTLASIDEKFSPVRMTGLNIDQRQLDVARQRVAASPRNHLKFVQGDACAMDFPEDSFDRVLAVECIFHFPSREAFFSHVGRILRPGGNLTLSDFLQPEGTPPGLWDDHDHALWGSHTAVDLQDYRDLAARAGLELTHAQDISLNVRPTYHWFGKLLGKHFPEAEKATIDSRFVMDVGGLGYCTLRFDRSPSP
jgi:ubiquinone/menaquinone biosynthesis C-methylase UbiE